MCSSVQTLETETSHYSILCSTQRDSRGSCHVSPSLAILVVPKYHSPQQKQEQSLYKQPGSFTPASCGRQRATRILRASALCALSMLMNPWSSFEAGWLLELATRDCHRGGNVVLDMESRPSVSLSGNAPVHSAGRKALNYLSLGMYKVLWNVLHGMSAPFLCKRCFM